MEDAIHAIRDCAVTKEVWTCLVPPSLNSSFFSLSLKDWILLNLRLRQRSWMGSDWPVIMASTCWCVWKWRNAGVFNGEVVPLEVNLETIRSRVRETELAWGVSTDRLGVPGSNTSIGVLESV